MNDYTSNPVYDIRKLPVGGWNSSKISVQSHGRWLQFADPISNNIINSTLPINYSKKYNPPKRHINYSYNQKQISDEGLSFDEYLSVLNSKKTKKSFMQSHEIYVPPIELSPERVTMLSSENLNDTSLSNTIKPFLPLKSSNSEKSRRPNSPNENSQSQASRYNENNIYINTKLNENRLSNQTILHKVCFNDADIPETARIVSKRKGELNAIKSFSAQSSRTKDRPKTAYKPRKTYNEACSNFSKKQYNNDKAMIVYSSKSKIISGNID